MNRRNRQRWFVGLAIAAIVLLTLFLAPQSNPERRGSTYSRTPDGYGAWFAYMQQQSSPVQRWERSPADLLNESQPMTLLRVNYEPQLDLLSSEEEAWIRRGNTLIELGILAPVSRAPFTTMQSSPQGSIKIETTRRQQSESLLGDEFGAIVWREAIGQGSIIRATTAHLAANAYQNEAGNFAFLADLVQQGGDRLFVDEYLHGYREPSADAAAESEIGLVDYLARTPLLLILIQGGVLFLVLLWAQNRRFGAPVSIAPPAIDNSEAYIQALAAVLHKAGRSEFILDTIGKAEQRHIQTALGLGTAPLDPAVIRLAWQQQTHQPLADLDRVLARSPHPASHKASQQDLLTWLQAIRTVRNQLGET